MPHAACARDPQTTGIATSLFEIGDLKASTCRCRGAAPVLRQAQTISPVASSPHAAQTGRIQRRARQHLVPGRDSFSASSRCRRSLSPLHGVIKLSLVESLLRGAAVGVSNAIVVFALFIMYQMYRYYLHPSIAMIVLSVLDVVGSSHLARVPAAEARPATRSESVAANRVGWATPRESEGRFESPDGPTQFHLSPRWVGGRGARFPRRDPARHTLCGSAACQRVDEPHGGSLSKKRRTLGRSRYQSARVRA